MEAQYILHRRLVESNAKSAQLSYAVSSWIDYPKNVKFIGSNSPGKKVVTYKVSFINQPDFVGWAILLGELAHSLRASLDNVVYSLSSEKSKKNEFPIFHDRESYEKDVYKKLQGISDPEVLEYIGSKQPFRYAEPKKSALYLLNQINIWDKHRMPKVVLFHPSELATNFSIEFQDKICEPTIQFNEKPIESGMWFVKYKFKYPFKKFNDRSSFAFQAQVEVDGIRMGIKETCDTLVREVHEITSYLGSKL